MLPPNHPQRLTLAEEVHARPPEPLDAPARATFVAFLVAPEQRPDELAHIAVLCAHYDVEPPAEGMTHFSAQLGVLRVKWERHGEFSTLTCFAGGLSAMPYSEPVASLLPPGWLAALPGTTIVAAHAKLVRVGAEPPDAATLARHFGGNLVVGSAVGDGAGWAYTDFRIHADGFARFLLVDCSFTPRQAGRMLQRLFEIETYRMMALLALPIARQQAPRTLAIERSLATLTAHIAADGGDDEDLLHELTRLAAELESDLAASQFRFGACRAYHALVTTRIGELREGRLHGLQTIGEFMERRLTPAVATCATVSRRLHDLSERVAQASGLLATRVGIRRERQNQALLASMDRRAKLQLRLQQTVEGLSVAAIVYYLAGLTGYLGKGAKAAGLPVDPDLVIAVALPVIALFVVLTLRRVHKQLHRHDEPASSLHGPL